MSLREVLFNKHAEIDEATTGADVMQLFSKIMTLAFTFFSI